MTLNLCLQCLSKQSALWEYLNTNINLSSYAYFADVSFIEPFVLFIFITGYTGMAFHADLLLSLILNLANLWQ